MGWVGARVRGCVRGGGAHLEYSSLQRPLSGQVGRHHIQHGRAKALGAVPHTATVLRSCSGRITHAHTARGRHEERGHFISSSQTAQPGNSASKPCVCVHGAASPARYKHRCSSALCHPHPLASRAPRNYHSMCAITMLHHDHDFTSWLSGCSVLYLPCLGTHMTAQRTTAAPQAATSVSSPCTLSAFIMSSRSLRMR